MWIVFACGSALFAGITAVLAKEGIRTTDSTVATALRTIVVLAGAWGMVFIVGSQAELAHLDARSTGLLVLSGLATGASWLCYFKALQLGSVSKVVPIDKLSTVLTVLLALIFLGERVSLIGALGVVVIAAGTLLMLDADDLRGLPRAVRDGGGWLLYALGSAFFAALTAILGKAGITGVESNLGTAIRTGVVLVMAWVMVAVTGKLREVRTVPKGELGFVLASGAPGWPGQRGGPHRQAERAGHRPLLRPHPAGGCQQAVPCRADHARWWDSCDGALSVALQKA